MHVLHNGKLLSLFDKKIGIPRIHKGADTTLNFYICFSCLQDKPGRVSIQDINFWLSTWLQNYTETTSYFSVLYGMILLVL